MYFQDKQLEYIMKLSIASYPGPKLDVYSINQGNNTMHVYEANLIRLLSQVFRVPYELHIPSDGFQIGFQLPDGNWTGSIGMVSRSEVNLSVGGVKPTIERQKAVNFSYPYWFSDTTFMTDKPQPVSTSLALFYPFSLKIWISIVAALLFFPFLVHFQIKRKMSYQSLLFTMFGSLLEKEVRIKSDKNFLKLTVTFWLIFTFVLVNSYKAVLLSFITSPIFYGIRSISDLATAAEENVTACYTWKGISLIKVLYESDNEQWKAIGKCMQKNTISFDKAEKYFLEAPPSRAFLVRRNILKKYEDIFFISKESFYPTMSSFMFSSNFCCPKYLNEMIHRLYAAGVFQKIEDDETLLLKLKIKTLSVPDEYDNPKVLALKDIKGAFIILISGYALSSLVFLLEIAVKYYVKQKLLCRKVFIVKR